MTKTIPLLQLTMALGLAFGLSACQTMSDMGDAAGNAASSVGDVVGGAVSALDPTTWFGGDDTAPAPTTASDTAASTSSDLANLPARPQTATPAQQQAAAQSLAADGAQARYSADSLRAGTEAAAAPPPAAADIPPSARIAAAAPPSADDAPPSAQGPSAQVAPPSAQPAAAPPSAALAQGTAAVPTGRAPVQTASIAPSLAAVPPPGAEPAVPAVPANTPVRGAAMGSQNPSDAALGFRPSAAPPLAASINQWVSAPIVARYRQTASNAGVAPVSVPAVPAVPAKGGATVSDSGAVVANLDAISAGPAASIAAMNGAAPTAVIYFPGDGITLSAAAKTEVKNAVTQYRSMGGAGSIRVVGHASSRTANMPVEKHLELIFDKSQQRANAVAQELIREGIPADRVLIEAVGDSQPVYYESMPQGEEGNRRAEIFVQS